MTSSEAIINVIEVKRPELDAQLVAESVAFQLEKQIAFFSDEALLVKEVAGSYTVTIPTFST